MSRALSENVTMAVAFVSGVIFTNAVNALLDGQFIISILSFLAVAVALLLKRFVDWSNYEE
jgi:hypothetical protein